MFRWKSRRYFWAIRGAHADALAGGYEIVRLSNDFVNAPREKFQFDHIPIGIGTFDVMHQVVNLRTIEDLPLYGYLTDPGVTVDLGLIANSVWLLYSDNGDSEMDEELFLLNNVWVQVSYNEQPFDLGNNAIEFDLIHIGKVVFETITTYDFGVYLQSFVPRVGGTATPELEYTVRDRTFEFAIRDTANRIYAWMKRRMGGGEEIVLLRYLDVFTKLEELATRVFSRIVRDPDSDVRLRSTYDGDEINIGTPYDFTTHFKRDLTPADDRGAALTRFDKQWACYSKESPGTNAPAIAGLFYPGDGSRRASGFCDPGLFPNTHDMLKAMTEEGQCKGVYTLQGIAVSSPRLTLKWFRMWDTDATCAAEFMPPKTHYDMSAKATRGKNLVSGCDAEVQQPKGENERSVAVRNSWLSANIRPYTLRICLTTMPCFDSPSRGLDNFYWITAPTHRLESGVDSDADTDFGGLESQRFTIGQNGFTFNRWYYLQDSDTTGGETGPDWIDAAEPLVMIPHREVVIDYGGLSGSYLTSTSVPIPTFASVGSWSDVGVNRTEEEYLTFIADYWVPAMRQQQRRSNLYTLCYGMRGIFSDRSQTIMSVKVCAPNAYIDRHRGTLFEIAPSDIREGAYPHLAAYAALISYEADFSAADMSVELYHKAEYI